MGLSIKRALVPAIPQEVLLSDALLGVIRVRVNEGRDSAYKPARLGVRMALKDGGVPFKPSSAGGLSLEIESGLLWAYKLTDDVNEYCWVPNPEDRSKVSVSVGSVPYLLPEQTQYASNLAR